MSDKYNHIQQYYNKGVNERHRSWSDATDILDEEIISVKTTRLLDCLIVVFLAITLLIIYSQLILPNF